MAKYVAAIILGLMLGAGYAHYQSGQERINFARSLGVESFQDALSKVSSDYYKLESSARKLCELEKQVASSSGAARQKARQELAEATEARQELATKYNSYWNGSAPNFSSKWGIPKEAPTLETMKTQLC